MRLILTVTLLASPATMLPQSLVNSTRAAQLAENFDSRKDDQPLRCEVTPIQPQLNFSFRFQAGYVVRVPMKQFAGAGHRWTVLTRVTPADGGPAALLSARYRLPSVPKTKSVAEWGGLFWVGEGSYRVEWLLYDEAHRVCRKQWKIETKLNAGERGIAAGIAPGRVAQVSFRRWSAQDRSGADLPTLRRLTLFLHAAPLFPRSTRFRVQDRLILLGSLASLLESVPARTVRLVIFNLDQQKELFRRDVFTPDDFDQAAQSLSGLQLQLVDYSVLKNARGHVHLLADLMNEQLNAPDPSDAVIFLGPATRYFDKLPQASLSEPSNESPRFFYFQYKPYVRARAEVADSIELAVKKVHGKKLDIRTPNDFARAIRQVESQVVARK
ncbi:MAG TPA: hypothetical protein VMH05_00265 [Bryobacteraceae bacterium]|nr:hypothetical protein [Bryobacteraceae bacterium]